MKFNSTCRYPYTEKSAESTQTEGAEHCRIKTHKIRHLVAKYKSYRPNCYFTQIL